MALTPMELLAEDPEQGELLEAIEAIIDAKLRTHGAIKQGSRLSFSFECVTPKPNTTTLKALKRLYTKAGWNEVLIDEMHFIITMTCPSFRRC